MGGLCDEVGPAETSPSTALGPATPATPAPTADVCKHVDLAIVERKCDDRGDSLAPSLP